jgi:hypothetical protein
VSCEPPTFEQELETECMERIMDFVLHYEWQLKQELLANGRLTGHQRSQLALVRRMLLDLGIDGWAVYGID